MKIQNMEDLFLEQIEDLYDAEKRLVKSLPKMVEASSSKELKQALSAHLEQTKGHVERLEKVFEELHKKPKGETCDAMKGLISEGERVIDHTDESSLRDAALISAGNRVEHYEIAGYGSARAFAQTLGMTRAVSLLEATLKEEKEADQKLTSIAASKVNDEALRASHAHH
jgi:ferritin-like metal-binding protein YciE